MIAALENNKIYFQQVSSAFTGKPVTITEYKKSRQSAFVALANLGDAFSRMLEEPRFRQYNSQRTHRFVVLNHTLTSHIATLAHYVTPISANYAPGDFNSMVQADIIQLQSALQILKGEQTAPAVMHEDDTNTNAATSHRINEQLKEMLYKRKQELNEKNFDTETRRSLGELKPVVDQFNLISSIAADLKKVSREIKDGEI
jgi:uncharacterized membrane protein YccC